MDIRLRSSRRKNDAHRILGRRVHPAEMLNPRALRVAKARRQFTETDERRQIRRPHTHLSAKRRARTVLGPLPGAIAPRPHVQETLLQVHGHVVVENFSA